MIEAVEFYHMVQADDYLPMYLHLWTRMLLISLLSLHMLLLLITLWWRAVTRLHVLALRWLLVLLRERRCQSVFFSPDSGALLDTVMACSNESRQA